MNSIVLKRFTREYSRILWEWRNDKETREYSKNSSYIPWEKHKEWLDNALNETSTYIYIAEFSEKEIGSIRFNSA